MRRLSVSSQQLHLAVLVVAVFILVALAIPYYIIDKASDDYERSQPMIKGKMISVTEEELIRLNAKSEQSLSSLKEMLKKDEEDPYFEATPAHLGANGTNDSQHAMNPDFCIKWAQKYNKKIDQPHESFCPMQRCRSCQMISYKNIYNCDKKRDCPDATDEDDTTCDNRNGKARKYYQNLNDPSRGPGPMFKPELCDEDDFINERCNCNITDRKYVICMNNDQKNVPKTLRNSVVKLKLSNMITNIDNVNWPEELRQISLSFNRITRIGNNTFKLTKKLVDLRLDHNQVVDIQPAAFAGLPNLRFLSLANNQLERVNFNHLAENLPILTNLDLSDNQLCDLDKLQVTRISQFPNLKELDINYNALTAIKKHWFSNMTKVDTLRLTNNKIETIENGAFELSLELIELNLSNNKLHKISRFMFAFDLNIEHLDLSGNKQLKSFKSDTFRELGNLKSIELSEMELIDLNNDWFNYLNLDFIYFSHFRYCHYAPCAKVCRPLTDGLSTSRNLLAFPSLRVAVWIVAIVCCLSNIFVLIWRSVSSDENPALSLLVKHLSIADLMMGVYLILIGQRDKAYKDEYSSHAMHWLNSMECSLIGSLNVFSSELSVFILTIITIERYRSITSIKVLDEQQQKQRARLYVTIAWLLAFLIAAFPLLKNWGKSDYYATSGLCLPLHIDSATTSGREYSVLIYLFINGSAVLISISLYVLMYSIIMGGIGDHHYSRPALSGAQKQEDAVLAIRFFLIVFIDCLCWVPIVVIKVFALGQVKIQPAIYGWIVIYIIPINSALNPILYTLAAPTYLRRWLDRLSGRLLHRANDARRAVWRWLDKVRPRAARRSLEEPTIDNEFVEPSAPEWSLLDCDSKQAPFEAHQQAKLRSPAKQHALVLTMAPDRGKCASVLALAEPHNLSAQPNATRSKN